MKTPEQKLLDKKIKNLRIIHNGLFSAFSFKKIVTWTDVWKHLGQNKLDNRLVTYKELKEYAKSQEDRVCNGEQEGQTIIRDSLGKIQPSIEGQQSSGTTCSKESPKENQLVPVGTQSLTLVPSSPTQQAKKSTDKFSAENDYGFVASPNEDFFPWWHQKKAIAELEDKIFNKKYSGVLVLAKTGTGKTYMMGGIARRVEDRKAYEGKAFSHMQQVYVGKRTILTQVSRALKNTFNLKPNVDVEVVNIERFRAQAGQYWVKQEVKIVAGKEEVNWKWKKGLHPPFLYLDESQGTKRPQATQSKIIYAYNDLPPDVRCLVSFSATPFVRVCEAKSFAVSTNRDISHLGFPPGTKLTNATWNAYSAIIANPSKPDDYNEAAVDRLCKDLEDYIVRVKGVHPQFEADNGVEHVQFESPEKREFYNTAIERFMKEKAKIDAAKQSGDSANICYLVVLLKYAMAAEFCHAEGIADKMHQAVKSGKAGVAAVKFKQTLIEIVNILITKYHWKRSDISLVWGGGQTAQTSKQKAKQKIKEKAELLKELGVDAEDLIKDAGLEDVEDRVIKEYPAWLKLGLQSPEERQLEIDRFQSGKTLFCVYTLKAGGVGLSLHHSDELTTSWDEKKPGFAEWKKKIDEWNAKHPKQMCKPGKCRRKPSGHAFEEDIPFIPVRPRVTYVTVSYNAIELVQGVGRVPRLTSLSRTFQRILCYAGTIEVEMGRVYSVKLRCLGSVVRFREDWMPIIFGGYKAKELADEFIDASKNAELDESSSMIDEGEGDGDEDESENGK